MPSGYFFFFPLPFSLDDFESLDFDSEDFESLDFESDGFESPDFESLDFESDFDSELESEFEDPPSFLDFLIERPLNSLGFRDVAGGLRSADDRARGALDRRYAD